MFAIVELSLGSPSSPDTSGRNVVPIIASLETRFRYLTFKNVKGSNEICWIPMAVRARRLEERNAARTQFLSFDSSIFLQFERVYFSPPRLLFFVFRFSPSHRFLSLPLNPYFIPCSILAGAIFLLAASAERHPVSPISVMVFDEFSNGSVSRQSSISPSRSSFRREPVSRMTLRYFDETTRISTRHF